VRFFDPQEEEKQGLAMILRVSGENGSLIDIAAAQEAKGKAAGWIVDGERLYWQVGNTSATVIVWQKNGRVKIEAMTIINRRLVDAQWEGYSVDKDHYIGTFKGMMESLVML
jgi:hypothetical protein